MPFGRAGLEQLDDAGQTVGDVLDPAMPPVWNVRMVSCVPGSPIDWAAMTPTASPSSISPPGGERPAVARRRRRRSSASQVSTERDPHAVDRLGVVAQGVDAGRPR